jgi:hypothetical protein
MLDRQPSCLLIPLFMNCCDTWSHRSGYLPDELTTLPSRVGGIFLPNLARPINEICDVTNLSVDHGRQTDRNSGESIPRKSRSGSHSTNDLPSSTSASLGIATGSSTHNCWMESRPSMKLLCRSCCTRSSKDIFFKSPQSEAVAHAVEKWRPRP